MTPLKLPPTTTAPIAALSSTEIKHLLDRKEHFLCTSFGIGLSLGMIIAILLVHLEGRRRGRRYRCHYFMTPLVATVEASFLFGLYAVYNGVPKVLTLGNKVGGFMPASCEASLPIEGRWNLPCTLKGLGKYLAQLFAGEHPGDFKRPWLGPIFIGTLMLGLLALVRFVLGPRLKFLYEKMRKEALREKLAEHFEKSSLWHFWGEVDDFERLAAELEE